MKHFLISIRMTFFLMIILGLGYPLFITGISQALFSKKANGSLIYEGEQLRGSELIAQNFEKSEYFWPRPSATSFNPLPSGGTNLGPTAKGLQEAVQERSNKLKVAHPGSGEPPQHLLFASASGLDPHQSMAAIQFQVPRIAAARGVSSEDVQKVLSAYVERRQFGILGEEVVNVLKLNRALDAQLVRKNN